MVAIFLQSDSDMVRSERLAGISMNTSLARGQRLQCGQVSADLRYDTLCQHFTYRTQTPDGRSHGDRRGISSLCPLTGLLPPISSSRRVGGKIGALWEDGLLVVELLIIDLSYFEFFPIALRFQNNLFYSYMLKFNILVGDRAKTVRHLGTYIARLHIVLLQYPAMSL